jgi:site-specific DNA recombinase
MNKLQQFQKFSPMKRAFGENKNAIIYTRVSTKEQADSNTSLETQKRYCENYSNANGYNIVGYFGGTHESAKSDDRKEFKRMLKFAKQSGSIGYIIVYSYDRFSRTGSSAAQITHELMNQGIQVKAVTQEVDATSASGKFQQNLYHIFSQFDNELRKDKTITGMSDLLRKGYWLWTPPLGYTNKNKYHKAVEWDIVIDQNGEHLKKAFKWRVQGLYSNAEIVRRLNSEGLKMDDRRLHEIFKNPFYCGILVCKMLPGEIIQGKHEPIVSQGDFLKINSEPSNHPQEHKCDNENLPLKQFVFCDACKTPLTGFLVKNKGLYYYKCRVKGCCCTRSAKKLHQEFEGMLKEYQVDSKYDQLIKEVMVYTYDSLTKEIRSSESKMKKQLTELDSKIETIEERYAVGEINQDIYQKFRTKYEVEKLNLDSNFGLTRFSSSNLQKAIDNALKISKNLSETWMSGDLLQKRRIQQLVFPSGLGYSKSKGRVQTFRVNSIFAAIPSLSTDLAKIKSGEPVNFNQFSARVTPSGLLT